jgi:putative long chain acyl-CoA synthase
VFTTPIRDALGDIPAVNLAAAYGVRTEEAERQVAVAAVSLRGGRSLTTRELGRALSEIPREGRPQVVHVVDRIPVTTWYRPLTEKLREGGIPEPGEGVQAWYLDASGEAYRPLTAPARRRLIGGGAKRRAASRPSTA